MQATYKPSAKKLGYTLVTTEYNPRMVDLMRHIGAEFLKESKQWRFHSAFLPLVERELALITPEMTQEAWLPDRVTGERVRNSYIYEHLPSTPEEAEKLEALRSQAHQKQEAPQPPATEVTQEPVTPPTPPAPKREPSCYTIGEKEPAGIFQIVGKRPEEQEVLVTLHASTWMPADYENNQDAGWYTDWYEPTEEEKQQPEYQRLAAIVTEQQAKEAAERQEQRERYEREREALRQSRTPEDYQEAAKGGIDLDLWDDLFAGTSDN